MNRRQQRDLPWIKTRGRSLITADDGKEIILRGFGLGGWLLPEGYMWGLPKSVDRPRVIEQRIIDLCGSQYTKSFWERYYQRFITEADICDIRAAGFDSVRLPFNSRTLVTIGEKGEIAFDEQIIGLIDSCLSWCRTHRIYLILDMHAAYGGQTGANIDDSADDIPRLFCDEDNLRITGEIWRMLALRYRDESTIAAYDLLNEPLPDHHSSYADQLLDVYRTLRDVIRSVDTRHMLMLEGMHWATDFSIFDPLESSPFDDNYLLQFHKYWNAPDAQSISRFIDYRERLQVPLFMGEGGENNLHWYTGVFPMLESRNISWNFWCYKKMERTNSPVSFRTPSRWDQLWESPAEMGPQEAMEVLDDFLLSISEGRCNPEVYRALSRTVPVTIPAVYYSDSFTCIPRIREAGLAEEDPVSILFCDRIMKPLDYQQDAGEAQPAEQQLCIRLHAQEWTAYTLHCDTDLLLRTELLVRSKTPATLKLIIDQDQLLQIKIPGSSSFTSCTFSPSRLHRGAHTCRLRVTDGIAEIRELILHREDDR